MQDNRRGHTATCMGQHETDRNRKRGREREKEKESERDTDQMDAKRHTDKKINVYIPTYFSCFQIMYTYLIFFLLKIIPYMVWCMKTKICRYK